MVLWFPLVLILSSVQAQVTESVITSIHQMEILYRSERSFVAQMSEFAHQLTLLSDSIKAYCRSFEDVRPKRGGSEAMHNPIDSHLLIRHLTTSWPQLKKTFENFHDLSKTAEYINSREQNEMLPSTKDLESSELALIRLIGAYKLNIVQFVKGVLDAPQSLKVVKSEGTLTAWDLGRIAIGLMNQQLYSPSIEMLDESIRILSENKKSSAADHQGDGVQFSRTPSHITPTAITENMRTGDLLELKYEAVKQHDDLLEKVIHRKIISFGDGLRTSHYNSRKLNINTVRAVKAAFQDAFQLQLDTIPNPLMEREQTIRLCRGEELRSAAVLSKLRCRLSKAFPPMKVEEVSLKPSIILVHDLINSVQTRRIVRKTARKLVGNDGGPSTSFKSALLDETDVEDSFIRKLESITGTRAQPGLHSELAVVRNYGLAGTFGIHSDYRGENYTDPMYGERMATAQLYLTPVGAGGYTVFPRVGVYVRPQLGSVLIYWNSDSSGQQDVLVVNSECPVVHGNKWVLLHWINAHANFNTRKCLRETTNV